MKRTAADILVFAIQLPVVIIAIGVLGTFSILDALQYKRTQSKDRKDFMKRAKL